MSSVGSDHHPPLNVSFRTESFCEEESPVDEEIRELIEKLRETQPGCDKLKEVNAALTYCKKKLKECVEEKDREAREQYMEKVVQLGLERQGIEENGGIYGITRWKGHEFEAQSARGRHNPCCEICMHTIWRLVQAWRRCRVCGLRAHEKCTSEVHRICAGVIAGRPNFSPSLDLCEETGLAGQDYACAECSAPLAYDRTANMEPRLCEYTGLLYCPSCHWKDVWTIPARIVHNMDSTPRPVCRASKQLLAIIDNRPLIDLSAASPSLIKYHKELNRVQHLRRNFLFMKCYFISCRNARSLRILQYLNRHQHFVEGSDMFTLKELRDLCQGSLLRDLEDIHTVFSRHITEECETCKGNGFFCEMCEDPMKKDEILYPFSDNVAMCPKCMAVFHAKCFEKKSMHCSRCERRKKRAPPPPMLDDE